MQHNQTLSFLLQLRFSIFEHYKFTELKVTNIGAVNELE